MQKLCRALGVRRSAILTAACALLVGKWCDHHSEVVIDFPVSRLVEPESMTFTGLMVGTVPLTLISTPGSSIAQFWRHTHARIEKAVQHQRFPVETLQNQDHRRMRAQGSGANPDQRLRPHRSHDLPHRRTPAARRRHCGAHRRTRARRRGIRPRQLAAPGPTRNRGGTVAVRV